MNKGRNKSSYSFYIASSFSKRNKSTVVCCKRFNCLFCFICKFGGRINKRWFFFFARQGFQSFMHTPISEHGSDLSSRRDFYEVECNNNVRCRTCPRQIVATLRSHGYCREPVLCPKSSILLMAG